MHVYSSDNGFRSTFLGILGATAFVTTWMLDNYVFPWIHEQLPFAVPNLLFFGLAFGVAYKLFYRVFDRRLWNESWIPDFVVAVPDLTGHWEGEIRTSYEGEIADEYIADGGHQSIPATLDIKQTWGKIIIHFETERSYSVSTGASFQTKRTFHPKLSYLFENKGADVDKQEEDEGPYDGTTQFRYRESEDKLVGYYYTGPARASDQGNGQQTTYGTAEFTRVSDESSSRNESNENGSDGSDPDLDVGGVLASLGGAGYLLKRRFGDEKSE
jgi:hypothetical protein